MLDHSLSPSKPVLTSAAFERIRQLVHDKCGIDLKKSKQQLVSARLGRQLRELNCPSYEDYLNHINSDRTGQAL